MIHKVRTILQLDELDTDGHSPVTFICTNGEDQPSLYYVKYRSDKSFKKDEIQCLVFEITCSELLYELNIPTPEIALIEISEIALNTQLLKHNKRYLKPGVIAFGSKEIPGADIVKKIEIVSNKREFNKLKNPEDLIKIAIFDLWVNNVDRHDNNLNLLFSGVDKQLQFSAIDHGFTFGGLKGMNTFGVTTPISTYGNLINSQFFRYIVKYILEVRRLEIANNFISCLREADVKRIVNNLFQTIPKEWDIRPQLEGRIIAYLSSEERISKIESIVLTELSKPIKFSS